MTYALDDYNHAPAGDGLGLSAGQASRAGADFELTFGKIHVFYPEATEERCTAAFLLDVDPVGLVRKPKGANTFALGQYTNDRPYVASSFLSVGLNRVLRSALTGRSKTHQELADTAIPLEAVVYSLRCRGSDGLLHSLFEPLGYTVTSERAVIDSEHPEWGDSNYYKVTLKATVRLSELLRHLTVLIPVLDDNKHYFVGPAEVDKLVDRAAAWLPNHPPSRTDHSAIFTTPTGLGSGCSTTPDRRS